jgi:hypothetical protein
MDVKVNEFDVGEKGDSDTDPWIGKTTSICPFHRCLRTRVALLHAGRFLTQAFMMLTGL